MASQICPKCNSDSFYWTTDDDESLTQWGCECGYIAFEDESFEKECSTCLIKSKSRLEDTTDIYWWCASCNTIEQIKKK